MKKILLTWANGMLGSDFIKLFASTFEILALDKDNGDITDIKSMDEFIRHTTPDILLNFAAYTNVEDAEDIGKKANFDVNALWVYTLAKLSAKYHIDFISISTDYVFDGTKKEWYTENDTTNPINSYGMAKYLWENLAKQENPESIIIRTSRLYGWSKKFNNFVNTMLNLSTKRSELKIVNDQFGSPTYTVDLSEAIVKVINDIEHYKWKILHFCNKTKEGGISRFEFAEEIFKVAGIKTKLSPCSSEEFITKAKRPQCSKLINWSTIHLRDWKEGLSEYLKTLA